MQRLNPSSLSMAYRYRNRRSILYYSCCAAAASFSFPSRVVTAFSSMSSSKSNSILGKTLVSVPDAIQLHSQQDVKFIDGTWWLDKSRNGRLDFENGPRIANARYLDIDDISSKHPENLPHMMPDAKLQSSAMAAMGIGNSNNDHQHLIVYGAQDCMFVTRAYQQLRTTGHPKEYCHLLDGSLQEWMELDGPIEAKGSTPSYPVLDASSLEQNDNDEYSYQATEPLNVVGIDELWKMIDDGKTMSSDNPEVLIVDARSQGRFVGTAPEPRPGLRGGHMPGATSLPIIDLLDPDNKVRFKPKAQLQEILRQKGILPLNKDQRIVSTCGSGVTACALLAALDIVGEDGTKAVDLYDGAWVQWGGRSDTPIVKD